MAKEQNSSKHMTEAFRVLSKAGFEVEVDSGSAILRMGGVINPADIRSKAAEILSEAGFQAYYLKEVYAYMGSKKPWRTDEEGYVEFCPWEGVFTKVAEQKKVAQLNKIRVTENTKAQPLATPGQ